MSGSTQTIALDAAVSRAPLDRWFGLANDACLHGVLKDHLAQSASQSPGDRRAYDVIAKYYRPGKSCVIVFGDRAQGSDLQSRLYWQIPDDVFPVEMASRARLWRFPHDLKLLNLPELFDGARVAEDLSSGCPEWQSAAPPEVSIEVLKYQPLERCVVLARAHKEPARHVDDAIGKINAKSDAAAVFDNMERLWAWSQLDPRLAVAQPLGFDDARQVLWQRRVGGEDFWQFAEREGLTRACALAALSLAGLHAAKLPALPRRGYLALWRRFAARTDLLAGLFPELHPALKELRAKCFAAVEAHGQTADVTAHGDFDPSRLRFRDGKAMIVDFASLRQSDPGTDLAHFIVGLHAPTLEARFTPSAVNQAARQFLQSYGSSVGWEVSAKSLHCQIAMLLVCRRGYGVLTGLEDGAAAKIAKYLALANRYLERRV